MVEALIKLRYLNLNFDIPQKDGLKVWLSKANESLSFHKGNPGLNVFSKLLKNEDYGDGKRKNKCNRNKLFNNNCL